MLNIPMLKLEKNNVYLNAQLEQQENNKQLMLDIISNIDLILNKNTNDTENYQTIRKSAYDFLNTISNNITCLEQLNIEIAGISKELENLQSEENKNTRTKEFYIVSFSNIKSNIAQYTEEFQKLQKKLELDNNNFNEFININNFKYNFESIENEEGLDSNTYKFTGFSIETNNTEKATEKFTLEEFNETVTVENEEFGLKENIIENKEFGLKENIVENKEFGLEENIVENKEFGLEENIVENEEFGLKENIVENKEFGLEENTVENEESILDETVKNISDEIIENLDNNFDHSTNAENIEQTNKIDELTNNFRKMLMNLANEDTTVEDTSSLISNYFKEIHELAETEIEKQNNEDSKIQIEENSLEKIQDVKESSTETFEEVTENIETVKDIQNNFETPDVIEQVETTIQEEKTENEYTEEFFEKPYETNEAEEIEDIIDTPITNLGYDFEVTNSFNNNFENLNNVTSPVEEKNADAIQKELLKNKLEKIITATADNETLIISEKTNNIYLPYKIPELINYIDNYPDAYSSLSDVVAQEFILPFDYFMKHPYKSRFFETYNLMRNRQGNSVFSSLAFGLKLMHRSDLNPAIIAACKTEDELKTYLYYLNENRLDEFKAFNIIYQVNPL